MKKFFSILFLIIIFSKSYSFTISAEVSRNATVNLELSFISAYIRNLDIYPKFFPNIVSVKALNETDSEWIYRIEAPLASPYNVAFILENKSSSADTLLFESKEKTNDYLYCNAVLSQISDTRTKVNFQFKISMTREKASDIHIFAGILGEKFLSKKMKERLENDLEEFISKATKDMYLASRTSGQE
ncbi:MAG TPA: hypothetical protein VGK25_14220 [Ignavibacteria bacterium]|jgi:uncharacterized membrane protein